MRRPAESWFSGYVQTYLERDLQALRAVENLVDFRRLMRGACLRIGGLLNQTELGRDVGISQPQVHRFLNLMETSFQAIRLPAYAVNRTKRPAAVRGHGNVSPDEARSGSAMVAYLLSSNAEPFTIQLGLHLGTADSSVRLHDFGHLAWRSSPITVHTHREGC